jgi:hypothetical protein
MIKNKRTTRAYVPPGVRLTADEQHRIELVLASTVTPGRHADTLRAALRWCEETKLRAASLRLLLTGRLLPRLENGLLGWRKPSPEEQARLKELLGPLQQKEKE